ncbi:hypothetical protein CR513_06476, partial [Mucuna pruriens]
MSKNEKKKVLSSVYGHQSIAGLLFKFLKACCNARFEISWLKKLDELENEVVIILYQLEIYFTSSFFDTRVHLIHLVKEIKLYIVEEVIEFCSYYMSTTKFVRIHKFQHEGRYVGKGARGVMVKSMVLPYLSPHQNTMKKNNLGEMKNGLLTSIIGLSYNGLKRIF